MCPYCGEPLTGGNSLSKRGKKLYQYYACYNKNCPSKDKKIRKSKFSVRKEVAEKSFVEVLKLITPKEEVIELFKSISKDVFKEQTHGDKIMNSKLQKELEELTESKKRLVRKFTEDKIQEDEYRLALDDISERENCIKSNLQIDNLTPHDFEKFLNNSLTVIQNLENVWSGGVLRTKRNIQNLIFPNGLSADFKDFQNSVNSTIFTKIGAYKTPYYEILPPGEFESPSTP